MGVQASTESDRILLEGYSIYIVDGDGKQIRSVYGGTMEHNGAAWLPGDRVVLASDDSGKGYVVFLDAAAKYPTDMNVGGGPRPTSPDQITFSGWVSHSGNHIEGEPVVLERTFGPPGGPGTAPQGTAVADTAFTDALGNFAFSDTVHAAPSNEVTWTVRYEETATYEGASWSFSRTAPAMPYDFNGDGYEDMAVGAPLENVGSIRDAGAVTVSYGGPSGLSADGSQTWTQDSPGVVGASETGDQFGYSTTSFDYSQDGYADLIVGSNNEAVGSQQHCGYITVIKGSAAGLTGTSSTARPSRATARVPTSARRWLRSRIRTGPGR